MGSRRPAFAFIFLTVMLDMLGFGIVTPVLPGLIQALTHASVGVTSRYMGLFISVWAVMQFFCSPVLGVLSDRFGRRPIILINTFGLGLDYFIMALAPTVSWLFLARILSGVSSSTMPTANAYVADITAPEDRARMYGLLGGALGIGFVLGPAVGGWLGGINARLPFWVCGGMSLLNAAYGWFVLPESLPKEKRQPAIRWKRANPVGSVALLRSNRVIGVLGTMTTLNYLAHEVYPTVFVLYAIYRYGWSTQTIGISLAVVGVSYVITSAVLIGPFVRWFGERTTLFLGLGFGALGFLLYGTARIGGWFLVAMAVQALWGLALPPAQSLMTRHVGVDKQGQLQGAISSLRGMAMIAGPAIFSTVFAVAIGRGRPIPGAPWFLAAGLVAVAAIAGLAVIPSEQEPPIC